MIQGMDRFSKQAAAAVVAIAVVALQAAGSAAAASGSESAATGIPGIVDIDTSLGYQASAAAGTGMVLSSSGLILTNNHVIRGATTVRVTDIDTGHTYSGTVLGYSVTSDIAVVQLKNASGLKTAPLSTSPTPKVGTAITAYGNAGGVGGKPAVAPGKITALNQTITATDDSGDAEQLHGLIETNAALEPGDSGGPIVDSSGHVVGIDTAASNSFQFSGGSGRGYAIPITRATSIASQIVAGHASATVHVGKTAFMGLSLQPPSQFFGQSGSGLTIADVVPGSPVAKAGLEAGDVITAFGGKSVSSRNELTALVTTKAPGDTVTIRWTDGFGQVHSATITLSSGPPQ
jgi:S1-C subfamily serine protease